MRRKLTKAERREIYKKMDGHCAYCGCELTFERMTVDHVVSLAHHEGKDDISNMLPACRSCNHYKSTLTLESFRKAVERFPAVLDRDSVTYRNAVRFGMVAPTPREVKFYFERQVKNCGRDFQHEDAQISQDLADAIAEAVREDGNG